jgi:hypothetical protein
MSGIFPLGLWIFPLDLCYNVSVDVLEFLSSKFWSFYILGRGCFGSEEVGVISVVSCDGSMFCVARLGMGPRKAEESGTRSR